MRQLIRENNAFKGVVETAAQQLVNVRHFPEGSFVTTPMSYPSGAQVVIRVEPSGSDFFVSDFGVGFQEAEMIGGERIYKNAASDLAESSGVSFDNREFFAVIVSEDQLPGAVAAIANCSQQAVQQTAFKVAEKMHNDAEDRLHDRLLDVFDKSSVVRDATLVGASNTEWRVASLVQVNRRKAVFEAVSKSPNSVVFAATKFNDISRLESAPARVAVVENKSDLGTYLGVLTQSASVIEIAANDDTIRRQVVRQAA